MRLRPDAFVRWVLVLSAVALFAACDDDDDGGTGPGDGNGNGIDTLGSFTATVSGSHSETLSGNAAFSQQADGTWLLGMGGSEEDASAIVFVSTEPRPGPGSHSLEAAGGIGTYYAHGATEILYSAIDGTLTLTESSASSMVGSFSFTASEVSGTGAVTVSGDFVAPNADQ